MIELLEEKGLVPHQVFNSSNRPTLEKLAFAEGAISFLPPAPMESYLDLLLEAKIPLVCGTTGMKWPPRIHEELKKSEIPWVLASNFAPGMLFLQRVLAHLPNVGHFCPHFSAKIEETHHRGKIDHPSGTALKWKKILSPLPLEIVSQREGEVVGHHSLTIAMAEEEITFQHKAHSRKVFAQGALWAMEKLLSLGQLKGGLHYIEDIIEEELWPLI